MKESTKIARAIAYPIAYAIGITTILLIRYFFGFEVAILVAITSVSLDLSKILSAIEDINP